ncbi:hypothetical protein EVAR_31530_1 [Eumeta japonica]|uniref:Uncharacterized protein n=1 Tax=Eumeta variegata TaxID=151549 RepID=A0A4C1YYP4_EUMVA|nr:hypothetical protein EVAR_31530_1 [Eumeta japonica]
MRQSRRRNQQQSTDKVKANSSLLQPIHHLHNSVVSASMCHDMINRRASEADTRLRAMGSSHSRSGVAGRGRLADEVPRTRSRGPLDRRVAIDVVFNYLLTLPSFVPNRPKTDTLLLGSGSRRAPVKATSAREHILIIFRNHYDSIVTLQTQDRYDSQNTQKSPQSSNRPSQIASLSTTYRTALAIYED